MAAQKKRRIFLEILEMMDRPGEFFRGELPLVRGTLYFLLADAIFTILVQIMVLYGIVPSVLKTSLFMSIVINFFSIVAGFCIISALMLIMNLFLGGKSQVRLLSIMLYAMAPALLFAWVPFIFIQFITIFWSLAMMFLGVRSSEKFGYAKAILYPAVFIVLVFAITIISQNYIFLGFLK